MIKLITIFDKHEQFIKLQYDSIIKHVKGEYQYILFNNAATEEQALKNKIACDELGITCVRINCNYNNDPSNIAGEALNISFSYLPNEKVFKLDSDMFFIADINLYDLFIDDLIYIANYKPNMEIMWSGVFGINMSKIDIALNFRPGVVPYTDTFGQSCLLTTKPHLTKKLFDCYNLQNITDGVFTTALNNDCVILFKDGQLISNERPEFYNDPEKLGSLYGKYEDMVTILKKHTFPEPYNVDMIPINGVNTIFHFKSANWCPWYTDSYINDKTEALKRYLHADN